jgi:hypothetical protein
MLFSIIKNQIQQGILFYFSVVRILKFLQASYSLHMILYSLPDLCN